MIKNDTYQQLINVVMLAGQIMLESGAETYRVEDTMERICAIYPKQSADTFVTPTGIFICIHTADKTMLTTIKRVKNRITNLNKIYLVNNISRELTSGNISLAEAFIRLEEVKNQPPPHVIQIILSAVICSFFFALLLGGTLFDGIIASFCIALIKFIDLQAKRFEVFSSFILNLIGGMICAVFAIFFAEILNIGTIYGIIIGAIMPLVPGIAITSAIRDMIYGDLVSGTARAVEAFLIAVAIAAGVGIMLQIWFLLQGGIFA